MERRRNRPEKYDREVMHKTVKAMQKIDEVKLCACISAEAMILTLACANSHAASLRWCFCVEIDACDNVHENNSNPLLVFTL